MTTLRAVTAALSHWMKQNDIDPAGLTLILSFTDPIISSKFDAALVGELESLQLRTGPSASVISKPISSFRMQGMDIRVKSPIHEIR